MSEFKFSCPDCGQRIGATDQYVGYQINCPACQSAIVVPGNPDVKSSIATPVLPGAPPPPVPPAKTRLSVSALGAPSETSSAALMSQVGASAYQVHTARKEKRSYTGLISGVTALAIVSASAYINRDWLSAKWKSLRGPTAAEQAAAQAEQAKANQPPPPPPEMTASEIWQKVEQVYKSLPSFSATGRFTSVLDYSKVNAGLAANGPVTVSAVLGLKMTRPENFRIDLDLTQGPVAVTTSGWSAAGGSFIQIENKARPPAQRIAEPPAAVCQTFNEGYSLGAGDIVRLFNSDPAGALANAGEVFSRTNDDTLDAQPCYVLAGTVKFQNVLVWVDRKTFLIPQTRVVLDGDSSALGAGMDDANIKQALTAMNNGKPVTVKQINDVKTMFKLKGTITDSYLNIQTNATITLAELEPPKPVAPAPPPAATAAAGGNQGGGGNGGGGGGGGGGRGGGGKKR
jgi:DNA-directed RNA polymerase subunit RPC12/RpoP